MRGGPLTATVLADRMILPEEELRSAVLCIADSVQPEVIILFGSYAYGAPTPDSDVDLLVIMETDAPSSGRSAAATRHLPKRFPSWGVLVKTPAEIERALAIGDFFVREIVTLGKTLYQKKGGWSLAPYVGGGPLDLTFTPGGEMNEVTNPLAWVSRAEGDYVAARSALRRKQPSTPIACFHAQQCIEKYLKAMLVARGQGFPKIHKLQDLSDLLEEQGVLIPLTIEQMEQLTKYAVDVRYPGDEPAVEEARGAYDLARTVRKFVRHQIGLR